MNHVRLLVTIFLFAGLNAEALTQSEDQLLSDLGDNTFQNTDIDEVVYSNLKKECYHFLYSIYRNMPIWGWPDTLVKQLLKTHLEEYLIGHLNTPESRILHLEYEAIDWNIHEMMKMHLSPNES